MGRAIGEVLGFGVGVAMSPLAVVAVVLMVVSPRGVAAAGTFVATWALSLAVVSSLALVVADEGDASADGAPATWVSVAKLVLALLLVAFAVRKRRGGDGVDADGGAPAWTRRLEDVAIGTAAGIAVVFAVVKPKNLLLTVGAGVAVAQVGASPSAQGAAIATFAALGTAGVAAPLVIHIAMPDRGTDVLLGWRDWMLRENDTIVAVVSLLIAAKLVGDALVALTG